MITLIIILSLVLIVLAAVVHAVRNAPLIEEKGDSTQNNHLNFKE
jgi:hypothetical protein